MSSYRIVVWKCTYLSRYVASTPYMHAHTVQGKYLVLSICYTGAAEQVNSLGGGGKGGEGNMQNTPH